MRKTLLVAFTCDTEFLPPWYEGTWEDMATWSFEKGVPVISDILEGNDIYGTFFTQATAIKKFPDQILKLKKKGHDIGSHGYNHEDYGSQPAIVWTEKKPVFVKDNSKKPNIAPITIVQIVLTFVLNVSTKATNAIAILCHSINVS